MAWPRCACAQGLAVAASGDVWVADSQNHCVRLLREDVQAVSEAAQKETDARRRDAMRQLPSPKSKASWEGRGARLAHAEDDSAPMLTFAPNLANTNGVMDMTDVSESFATDCFGAEAQLFEREAPAAKDAALPPKGGVRTDSARGGWTYTGAASVTLRRSPHRTATLCVQVHGAPSAELSVLRPGQLKLRDTAFVVCTRELGSVGGGLSGFGVNELGLRFSTTTAAASLLAACEAMVSGDAAAAALMATLPEPRDEFHEPPTRDRQMTSVRTAGGPLGVTDVKGGPMAPTRDRPVSAIPTLRRPRAGAAAADDDASLDARVQQAEQDVLRLSARLAERDVEAGRLRAQLEQSQTQLRSRDAKVAELTRRLALLSKRT